MAPSVEDIPGKNGGSPAMREVNQHLHRKHGGDKASGNLWSRLIYHEELHVHDAGEIDHTHEDYELPAEWDGADA